MANGKLSEPNNEHNIRAVELCDACESLTHGQDVALNFRATGKAFSSRIDASARTVSQRGLQPEITTNRRINTDPASSIWRYVNEVAPLFQQYSVSRHRPACPTTNNFLQQCCRISTGLGYVKTILSRFLSNNFDYILRYFFVGARMGIGRGHVR